MAKVQHIVQAFQYNDCFIKPGVSLGWGYTLACYTGIVLIDSISLIDIEVFQVIIYIT